MVFKWGLWDPVIALGEGKAQTARLTLPAVHPASTRTSLSVSYVGVLYKSNWKKNGFQDSLERLKSSRVDVLRVSSEANLDGSVRGTLVQRGQLVRGAAGAGDQLFVEEAALTRDPAHRACHEVASIPGHMSSEAVADQMNIPKRKAVLLLQEGTRVCERRVES